MVILLVISGASVRAQVTLLFEGFEAVFPGSWVVADENSDGEPAYWKDVDLSFGSPYPRSGDWMGYCAGFGYAGTFEYPSYQSDMAATMRREVNLVGATGASLSFWFNIPSIESCCDRCEVYVDSTLVWSRNEPTTGWQQAVVNLAPYAGTTRTIAFEFSSDDSIEEEGWYLDDISVTSSTGLPNLVPHRPSGWSSNLVLSTVSGTTNDSAAFTPTNTIYVDWAVINNGSVAVASSFRIDLFVDNVLRNSWNISPPLNPSAYAYGLDYSIGLLSAGNHTIRIVADASGVVNESNETDNEYARTIFVSGNPDIRISPLSVTLNLTNASLGFALAAEAGGDAPGDEPQVARASPEAKLLDAAEILAGFQADQSRVKIKVNLVSPPGLLKAEEWASKLRLQDWQRAVRFRQEEVIGLLGNGGAVRHRFENQAGFSAEVTRAVLEKLMGHPLVDSIEPVRIVEPGLAQGIPLMRAETYRSIFNGAGVAVAIVDSGVDYTHPRLGGGGFPNGKVIGGYDYGDLDSDPAPFLSAHGTACAGIAAGDLGTVGDYIGGVAYNAKIYALKITAGSSGSATDDAIIAAWNWCITHKNDDPNNPILAISTSFGGGRYFSACDASQSAYATAANNAAAAGITVLVSAGNEGYCDSLAAPACVSGAIAVGAVYDASYGTVVGCITSASCVSKTSDGSCPTGFSVQETTAADKVPAYSNTAGFLGLLAPANRAHTTDIVGAGGYGSGDYTTSFGGTSAACPYAAGGVAALQSAAKSQLGRFLTPSEVRARLIATGDNISDTKAPVTKPRINLARAIESLGQTASFTIFNDGVSPLNVSSISPETPASWLQWQPAAPFMIAAGEQQVVALLADSISAPFGQSVVRLVVTSNDPDESPFPGGVFVTLNKTAGRPILKASLAGNKVVISWTTNSAGFNLYSGSTLPPSPGWSLVGGSPVVVGSEKFVTNNLAPGTRFFRLQK